MGKFGDLSVTKVIKDVLSALELFGKKCNAEVDPDKRKMQTEVVRPVERFFEIMHYLKNFNFKRHSLVSFLLASHIFSNSNEPV